MASRSCAAVGRSVRCRASAPEVTARLIAGVRCDSTRALCVLTKTMPLAAAMSAWTLGRTSAVSALLAFASPCGRCVFHQTG